MRGYYIFHMKHNNFLSPEQVILTVYIVFNIVHSAKSIIRYAPGVGVLTCHRQIPCVSPLNLAWGSKDVVDRCFTHNFMYYCHIYKKVECYCILN